MKKLILLAIAVIAVISPSLCSAQDIFPAEILNRKGVELVKFSPWLLKNDLVGDRNDLKRQGIEKLTAFEFFNGTSKAISNETDNSQYSKLVADVERAVKNMKLESVLEVKKDGETIKMLVNALPGEEKYVDKIVILFVKDKGISAVGMEGLFDMKKMMYTNSFDVQNGKFYLEGIINMH